MSDERNELEEIQEGAETCVLRAEAHCCTTETHTALSSNYPPNSENT